MKTKQATQSLPESKRLGSYLTAAATLGTLASSADAAIVSLNLTSISGPNGGLAPSGFIGIPVADLNAGWTGGYLFIANSSISEAKTYHGMAGVGSLTLAAEGSYATPINFQSNQTIGDTASFAPNALSGLFRYTLPSAGGTYIYESSDFDSGSYMGFRVADGSGNYNYGWLEVTWKSADSTFEILGGAYESDLNAPILAGAAPGGGGVSGIPEPTNSLCTLGLLVSGIMIRRRGKKAA